MKKLAVLIIIEPGLLEAQAKLLIDSIHRFLVPEHAVEIFTFSPRKDRKPSSETLAFLQQYVKHHHNEDLNQDYDYFPLANGLCASKFFEKNYSGYDHVLLTDTDTVFLNCLPELVFEKETLFVSPADNKGVGSTGDGDANDPFWQDMFKHFNLPLPLPSIDTTVRTETIRPYHNSGFVLANNLPGLFTQWYTDFDELMLSNIKPGFIGRDGTNYGFFEQLVLSITASRYPGQVRYFPKNINYPIPFRPFLKKSRTQDPFEDLVHVHYHKWFQHPGFLAHITSENEKKTSKYQWLQAYLPLLPEIKGPFKC